MSSQIINNGAEALDLYAGATLQLAQASPGASAQIWLIASDAAIAFTSAQLIGSAPVVIGPFTVNCKLAIAVRGTVSLDIRFLSGTTASPRAFRGAVANQAAMLALSAAMVGDWCQRSDLANQIFELTTAGPATLANWTAYPAGGVTTFAALTDAASATIATTNTSVANALAGKADSLAPTVLTASTAITHAAHLNRPLSIAQAGATTMTFAGNATSGALAGDAFELLNTGAGTVTLAGTITAAAGYTLTIPTGVTATAVYNAATDSFYSTTPSAVASSNRYRVWSYGDMAFVTGAVTGSVQKTLALPAVNANGRIRVTAIIDGTGVGGTKTFKGTLGGTLLAYVQLPALAANSICYVMEIAARNATNLQVSIQENYSSPGSTAATLSTVDLSISQNFVFTLDVAAAADTARITSLVVELIDPTA